MSTIEKPVRTRQLEQTPSPALSRGLDYYKPTMSQLAFEQEPDAQVSFSLQNRGPQTVSDYVSPSELTAALERFQAKGWSLDELRYLGRLQLSSGDKVFSQDFLGYLSDRPLPPVEVTEQPDAELAVTTTGEWPMVTYWETLVMSELNEIYFENYLKAHDLDPAEVYAEGDRRVSDKIHLLRCHPTIKFADFGTRRHFSAKWQEHVLTRLVRECPGNFIGTSNVGLAKKLGLKPIGTFAHEMPMVYAGLAESGGEDIRQAPQRFLSDWFARYGQDYAIALTDTFGSESFMADADERQATLWRGLRHDSGDPYAFGYKALKFYTERGIDPETKTLVFSDGLDIYDIINLQKTFCRWINLVFGWGTNLTNDLGIKALNVVMKATAVNGIGTVKLSDVETKHTGSPQQIAKYQEIFKP